MENDNKKIIGYIGIGIFLILNFQQVKGILFTAFEYSSYYFNIKPAFILIGTNLLASILSLLLFVLSLLYIKKLYNKGKLNLTKTIIILFLLYIVIFQGVGFVQGIWIGEIINSNTASYTAYQEYIITHLERKTVISVIFWLFEIALITLFLFLYKSSKNMNLSV